MVFSRFDDCHLILRDNRFGNGDNSPDRAFGSGDSETLAFRREMMERRRHRPVSMLALDPPEHTRQRALVSRAFTPRRIEELRARIAELVDERLDDLAQAGTGDAMTLLADPLPVSVISEMLGVPQTDWPDIRALVSDLAQRLVQPARADGPPVGRPVAGGHHGRGDPALRQPGPARRPDLSGWSAARSR